MSEQKTHWRKNFNPDYLGSWDLLDGESHPEMNVIITKISREEVIGQDGKKELCVVARLKNCKPMILNATNHRRLAKLFQTPYIEDWVGKSFIVYVEQIKAFGENHDALRVKQNPKGLPILSPSHPKWEGAKKAIAAGNYTIQDVCKKYDVSPKNRKALCTK